MCVADLLYVEIKTVYEELILLHLLLSVTICISLGQSTVNMFPVFVANYVQNTNLVHLNISCNSVHKCR